MKTPHYLRFVQALALAAAVPACSGADEPKPTSTETPAAQQASQTAPAPVAASSAATPSHDAHPTDADAGVDAGRAFSSGPIVPPELPMDFA